MNRRRSSLMPVGILAALLAAPFGAACSEPNGGSDLFGGVGGGGGSGGEGGAGTSSARATGTTSSTSSSGTTVTSSTSSGPSCGFGEFGCNDGSCIVDYYECDGFLDCLDGSDEPPVNLACPSSTTSTTTSSSTGGPGGWTCSSSFYGVGDGCDCGCGILDPDCPSASAAVCEYCTNTGSCAFFGCDEIDSDRNWLCDD